MNSIYINDNNQVLEIFKNNQNKFKMIYIDPPYNTGSKFSYSDSKTSIEWSLMMKPLLQKSKDILEESGSIFISIDDNELCNLIQLCDEVFGKKNFIANIITKQSQRSNSKHVNIIHEYVLVYAKNKNKLHEFKIPRNNEPFSSKIIATLYKSIQFIGSTKEKEKKLKEVATLLMQEHGVTWIRNYSNVSDENKIFFGMDLSTPSKPRRVSIPEINLFLEPLENRGWSSDKKFIQLYKSKLLHFKGNRPYEIHYLEDSVNNITSILDFYSRQGTEDLKKLGLNGLFDTPKPVEMIKYLIRIGTNGKQDRILDFFAGSGTTAQAVLEVNLEDNKNLNFTLVQISEKINNTSKSFKVCSDLGIKPLVSEILLYRLNKFLQIRGIKNNYEVIT